MVIPGLHVSLGLFLRFFNLLEDACHDLDTKIGWEQAKTNGQLQTATDFQQYVEHMREAQKLLREAREGQDKALQLEEVAGWFVVNGNIPEEDNNLLFLRETVTTWRETAQEKVCIKIMFKV